MRISAPYWSIIHTGDIARAVYAALLFIGIGAGSSQANDLVHQKMKMLESYLSSPKIQALKSDESEQGPALVAEGHLQLESAQALLAAGKLQAADAALDEGLRSITLATRGTRSLAVRESRAHTRYLARHRQINLYLDAISRTVDPARPGDVSDQIGMIQRALEDAEDLARRSQFGDADLKIERAHAQTVNLISRINAGKTIVSSLTFDSPEAEFKYELERNRSYEMLVTIAMQERGPVDPSLGALADRLVAESHDLRAEAEVKAKNGAHQPAIRTMEQATDKLLRALKAAGLPVFE